MTFLDPEVDIPLSAKELARVCANPDRFNIVMAVQRPGVAIFSSRLEFEHFKPDTQRNMLFDLYHSEVQGGLYFITVSIPKEDRHFAEKIAREEKLRIVDGVPHFITPQGISVFPVNSPNTFTLENGPDHPCNKPGFDPVKAQAEEIARCEAIYAAHREWWQKLKGGG